MQQKHIAILDFGSQYTHLIARRIRQLGVFARIYPPETSSSRLKNVWGVILSGGPNSVYEEKIKFDQKILKLEIPILGICYGLHLINYLLGGKVKQGSVREYGLATLTVRKKDDLLAGWQKREVVWMSHGDLITKLPKDFTVLAGTKDCPVACLAHSSRKLYGVQFHPEVVHTEHGLALLKNFVFNICQAKKEWNVGHYLKSIKKEILRKVGERKVFLLVSGGVDSAVCFGLLNRILGKNRVFGLHIDTGFMRKNESKIIKSRFLKLGFSNLKVVDATSIFGKRLLEVINPEKKRKIMGKTYLDVQQQAMRRFNLSPKDWILAQGTIYPDTIESGGTKYADKIKTHHNRVKEIEELIKKGLIVEPLNDLYKDEVRLLGKKIGLPPEIISRHPFPGPGLAIRIICSNRKESGKNLKLEKSLDKVLTSFNTRHRLFLKGRVLPFRSVGVQGDERTYAYPAAISGDCPDHLLEELGPAIGNKVREINRVLKVVFSRKDDLEKGRLKKLLLTRPTVKLLQEVDAQVSQEMKKANLEERIWQFPVILAPFSLAGGMSVILRPVQSEEAMTVRFFKLSQKVLARISSRLSRFSQVDLILYDITNKPPATIEWE